MDPTVKMESTVEYPSQLITGEPIDPVLHTSLIFFIVQIEVLWCLHKRFDTGEIIDSQHYSINSELGLIPAVSNLLLWIFCMWTFRCCSIHLEKICFAWKVSHWYVFLYRCWDDTQVASTCFMISQTPILFFLLWLSITDYIKLKPSMVVSLFTFL